MAEEDGGENKATKRGEEENACPNGTVEKTTPVRKARAQTKGGQKLFGSGGDAAKTKGTGERHGLILISWYCSLSDPLLFCIYESNQ